MLVLSTKEMAGLDQKTIREIGIPGIVLMENAAQGAAAFFLRVIPDLIDRRITVVAGSGNNAGDGFALARIFHSKGAEVNVVCLRDPMKLTGDALTNFSDSRKDGAPRNGMERGRRFRRPMGTTRPKRCHYRRHTGNRTKQRSKGSLPNHNRQNKQPRMSRSLQSTFHRGLTLQPDCRLAPPSGPQPRPRSDF